MALDLDDSRRRRRHERIRQKQKKEKRRRQLWLIGTVLGVLCILASATCGGILLWKQANQPDVPLTPTPSIDPTHAKSVIHLAFGGDLNVTDNTVAAGKGDTGYDYTDVFRDIAPIFANADAAVLNFEGNLCGEPYGAKDTRAPQALATAIKNMGVDLVQTANSCAINNGLLGLQSTLSGLRAAGLTPLGSFSNAQEATQSRGFTLCSIGGIKVAFVAFTKGVGNMALPAGSESCVNLLYTDYTSSYQQINRDGITKVLQHAAAEKPDITVALVHWGSEYNSQISKSQTRIVELMQEQGVDAIIGTHSHYVQTAEFDKAAGTVVAYSLGDFWGDANKNGTDYSLILDLEITRDPVTGETKITGVDYTPIYTVTPEKDGVPRMQILQIESAMAHYEANGIGKVSDTTYVAMKSALEKINSRIPKS